VQRRIVAALEDGPELARVIHMRTVHMAPDSVLVAAKVAIREDDSAESIAKGIDAAERRVRAAVPIAKTIYLEPDIYRPTDADHADPAVRAVESSHSPLTPGIDGPMKPENPENPAPTAPGASDGSGATPNPRATPDPRATPNPPGDS
jgi:hypothetical protein